MTLYLPIKKEYFDMIRDDIKKEEYRGVKPYWIKRLAVEYEGCMGGDFMDKHNVKAYVFKSFETVTFINGYGKNSPRCEVECLGIQIGLGMLSWGAELDVEYFIIQLGKVISK